MSPALGFLFDYIFGTLGLVIRRNFPKKVKGIPAKGQKWWQKPGLGIMYQIETRPGWKWERDYIAFNKSLTDPQTGKIKFPGPFCKMDEWVALSKETCLDYHIFEVKWHDGICWFNTKTTEWKTPTDYVGQFAKLSQDAGLPFMFYYSTVFDHNPELDSIQPDVHHTMSFIGAKADSPYIAYMQRHLQELVDQYHPDGFWFDIFFNDHSSKASVEYLRKISPETIITFNFSNLAPTRSQGLTYTTCESHGLHGPIIKFTEGKPVPNNCWVWANMYRVAFDHPWEIVSPCGEFWQIPTLRKDINELVRMAAITMACGGMFTPGVSALLSGDIDPEHVRQMKALGKWYDPRKHFFTEAAALRDWGREQWGATTNNSKHYRTIGSYYSDHVLLHVINMFGEQQPVTIDLKGSKLKNAKEAFLEPEHRPVQIIEKNNGKQFQLAPQEVDLVDTIISIC
jgi:hypothetical protein